ncbi:prepilin-type N-terminal cleavage/methylation domain-containing protein [Conyzicola nivalis]|uniref:Prepilin-type N-terminal cleavage/methylation domain-containing protein n=1 Tax=Conyzicola nivalis TaxID=1477021 RepID=A0ABV2QPB1_9MICO
MKNLHARALSRVDREDGFTLIEVVVAIVILGILSTASLGIYISSANASTMQQRREVAVTIANQQMELVNSWSTEPNAASGTSELYTGRKRTDVTTAWAANSTISGVAQTYPVWDQRLTPPLPAAIPIVKADPVQLNGTTFSVETLLGTCYQLKGIGGNCGKVTGFAGYPTAPSSSMLATYTPLTRVIVIVRWTAGSMCSSGDCSYVTSTLIDLNGDLTWNTHD